MAELDGLPKNIRTANLLIDRFVVRLPSAARR